MATSSSRGRSTSPMSRWRAALWPIHRFELKRFIPLLLIYALIGFNYSVLRATKDALVITAPSSGAEALPFIKMWAILPMAFLFTFLFAKLSNRCNIKKIFYIMMGIFLSFFLLFSLVLYPHADVLHPHAFADHLQTFLPKGFHGLIALFRNWTFTLFYVMSELWGTMIMTVLFWGVANQVTHIAAAKRYYAIIGLGANLSSILSGYFTIFLERDVSKLFVSQDKWGVCLNLVTGAVVIVGLITVALFWWYTTVILKKEDVDSPIQHGKIHETSSVKMSLRKGISYLAQSKYLIYIAVIVLAYNISLNMVEVIWKNQIHHLYPNPVDFNVYMGRVMIFMGCLSTLIALFICGPVIRRLGWTFTAMVTPAVFLVTGALFFWCILFQDTAGTLAATFLGISPPLLTVGLGAIQNCAARACKYTVFDITKEMAFIPLTPESKLKGKAIIDGVGSRLGKSGGAVIYQFLLVLFGTVSVSAPYAAVLLFFIVVGWLFATKALGRRFNELTAKHEALSIGETPAPVEEAHELSAGAPIA